MVAKTVKVATVTKPIIIVIFNSIHDATIIITTSSTLYHFHLQIEKFVPRYKFNHSMIGRMLLDNALDPVDTIIRLILLFV